MAALFGSVYRFVSGNPAPPPATLTASTADVESRLRSLCGSIHEMLKFTIQTPEDERKILGEFTRVLPLLITQAKTSLAQTAEHPEKCVTIRNVVQQVINHLRAIDGIPHAETYTALRIFQQVMRESRGDLIVLQGMQKDDPGTFQQIMQKVQLNKSIVNIEAAAILMHLMITDAPLSVEEEWDDQPEVAAPAVRTPATDRPKRSDSAAAASLIAERKQEEIDGDITRDEADARASEVTDAAATKALKAQWDRENAERIATAADDRAAAARAAELGDATRAQSINRRGGRRGM